MTTSPRRQAPIGAMLTMLAASFALGCGGDDESSTDDAGAQLDAGVDALAIGDLTIDTERTIVDMAIEERVFEDDACELDPDEACIGEAGLRRLLRFSVETPNLGNADIFVGAPSSENPLFQYSACHDHFHYLGFASYRLLNSDGQEVGFGHKQAFCLVDAERYLDEENVSQSARYRCDFQGIQQGWSDVYVSDLPCQFVDITDLASGDYNLEIEVNTEQSLEEISFANNVETVPITLELDSNTGPYWTPTESCPASTTAHAGDHASRECGWNFVGEFDCTPGVDFHIGCAESCELGSCTGDPMLRICDAARGDENCSFPAAIAHNNDAPCGGRCPGIRFAPCPDSGRIQAYTAPRSATDAYSCDVAIDPAPGQ